MGDQTPPSSPLSSPLPSHWPLQRMTIVYFHSPPRLCWSNGGGQPNCYIIVWSSLAPPATVDPTWPHSQYSKAPSVSPNSQGVSGRVREARRGKKTRRGKGDDSLGGRKGKGKRERGREREASAWLLSCLSESICQIVFAVWRLPHCLPFSDIVLIDFFSQLTSISTFLNFLISYVSLFSQSMYFLL